MKWCLIPAMSFRATLLYDAPRFRESSIRLVDYIIKSREDLRRRCFKEFEVVVA